MASNFYEAGIEVLLQQGFFNDVEKKVLRWLLSAAQESAATYWDAVTDREIGSDLDVVIRNIIAKCRHYQLHDIFARLKESFNVPEPIQAQA